MATRVEVQITDTDDDNENVTIDVTRDDYEEAVALTLTTVLATLGDHAHIVVQTVARTFFPEIKKTVAAAATTAQHLDPPESVNLIAHHCDKFEKHNAHGYVFHRPGLSDLMRWCSGKREELR